MNNSEPMSKGMKNFEMVDPFNNNLVKGKLQRTYNTKYGMLHIETVNGKPCKQEVWATPKMHYPMDKEGNYRPPPFDRIEGYEKLDGTNILAFTYHDIDGIEYISYKTRQMPFLENTGSYKDYLSLWKEMLEKYPAIPDLVRKNKCNLSFELYGKRNKIMIEYDASLECALLFGVKPGGVIIPPTELMTDGVPVCTLIKTIDKTMTRKEFEQAYEETVEYLNKNLKVEESDNELFQDMVYGMEGSMWYLISDSGVVQEKCKPDYIRDIHWAASGGIPTHSIRTTIINSFEQGEEVTYSLVKDLLLEEFQESEIDRKADKIEKMMRDMVWEKKMKDKIFKEYVEKGFDIVCDKRTCMRHFGQKYEKKLASKIFTWLNVEFGVGD